MSELLVVDLGTLSYATALELQREIARRRISGEITEDVLLLVEHPPVVTLGRTAKGANLVASPALLAAQGVELFEVERGGDITFHGPGQLVGYPILDLKRHRQDLHWYLRQVEEALIGTIGEFGLLGSRVEKYTGVWVSETGTGNRRAPAEGGQMGTESLYRDDEDPSLALGMTTMTCHSEPRVPAKRADEGSSSSRKRALSRDDEDPSLRSG